MHSSQLLYTFMGSDDVSHHLAGQGSRELVRAEIHQTLWKGLTKGIIARASAANSAYSIHTMHFRCSRIPDQRQALHSP